MNLLISAGLLVAGFFLLVKGADWFVDGAAGFAKKLGVPQLVIGLTIVAMGTSAPEAAVSITAAIRGNADITIGNIVGSNIFNILFIVGTTALIMPVTFQDGFLVDTIVAVAAGFLLLAGVAKTKTLKKPVGIVMLIAYVIFYLSFAIEL